MESTMTLTYNRSQTLNKVFDLTNLNHTFYTNGLLENVKSMSLSENGDILTIETIEDYTSEQLDTIDNIITTHDGTPYDHLQDVKDDFISWYIGELTALGYTGNPLILADILTWIDTLDLTDSNIIRRLFRANACMTSYNYVTNNGV